MSESTLDHVIGRNASLANDACVWPGFERGDVRTSRSGDNVDVVLSLLLVFSCQTSNYNLLAAFRIAASHLTLREEIFHCWYGPAILTQRPEVRVKRLEDDALRVVLIAEPETTPDENKGTVNYWILMNLNIDGRSEGVSKDHETPYPFVPKMERIASPWFSAKPHYAWETRRAPDLGDRWGGVTVMERSR